MSDQAATSTSSSIHDVLPSTAPKVLTPQNRELECSIEGCDFRTISEAGMKRHVTRTHTNRKPNKAKAKKQVSLTPLQRKQAAIPNLSPIWQDGDQIIMVHPDGSVWVAKKLTVV